MHYKNISCWHTNMLATMKLSNVLVTCNLNNLPVLRSNHKMSTSARSHQIQPKNLAFNIRSKHQNYNSLGGHLAQRLVQIGVSDVFSVPGDFNLVLLDHLVAEPQLNLIGCCNELNAGYAADGYARSRGVGACVVTFTVGGLSVMNAIAGAYSEDLPVICIVGGPNSNDYGANNRILHHSIGLADFSQELKCFQQITCQQVVVNNLDNAQEQIDGAIAAALEHSKPVYISISCNLPGLSHPSFLRNSLPFSLPVRLSNTVELELAVETAAEFLNKAVKPILLAGPKLRSAKATEAFHELSNASGYSVAIMPTAKGLVLENHPRFIGTYWGTISTPYCNETVELADAYLIAGPVFNDYINVGHSLLLKEERAIIVQPHSVRIGKGPTFRFVEMKDFLVALAKRIKHNTTSHENYERMYMADDGGHPLIMRSSWSSGDEIMMKKEALRVNVLYGHLEKMLSSNTTMIADTGVSWFSCQKLKLPQGCGFEVQMHYGSIGWSVGASLGYAQAASPNNRVIACIGDGSFQMGAQEVSTMLRCGQNSIIFLINNGGYTIEEVIHEGSYNVIKNWNYTALVDAINNGEHKCWTTKVSCEEELVEAMKMATEEKRECLCFIEVLVHKDDTSKELVEFCLRTSLFTSRSPTYIL
ncbi:hypothetical protein CsatB_028255 [Cannabis sativa]